jgi:outer membrane protein assembly factor BamE
LRYLVILLAMLCASCGTALPTVKPFKIDVQQGNVVTSKMLLQLRPGMTQSQVRFIMGTPLIQDSFHGKRWDYVYQMRTQGKVIEQRRVILDFENDLLKTVRGDVAASAGEAAEAATDAANSGTRVINPTAKAEEKNILAKLKFWEKDEAELADEAAAVKAQANADMAAKNAVALDKDSAVNKVLTNENAAPAEEKSMLSVPIAVLPAVEAAVAVADMPVVNTPAVEAPIVVEPKVTEANTVEMAPPEALAISPPLVSPQSTIESPSVVDSVLVPEVILPTPYSSSSGMQFDRTLRLAPEDIEAAVKPEAALPRAGNKSIPKPKDLPADTAPSFFDRMLEKIGF